MDTNRKTNIPVKNIPAIVDWLLNNCSKDEILFMGELAGDRRKFPLLNSIFTRLTDYNVHEVFYEKMENPEELMIFRAAKRGEVAGLKAFSMACQSAREDIERRKKEKKLED